MKSFRKGDKVRFNRNVNPWLAGEKAEVAFDATIGSMSVCVNVVRPGKIIPLWATIGDLELLADPFELWAET